MENAQEEGQVWAQLKKGGNLRIYNSWWTICANTFCLKKIKENARIDWPYCLQLDFHKYF